MNTFLWTGAVGIAFVDSNNTLNLSQSLRSKLIRSDPTATQGEYDGFIGYQGKIDGAWDVLARTSSLIVSDNQSIDLSRLAQHQGLIGLGYESDLWKVNVLGGYEFDAQEDAHDEGPAFDASLESADLRFQEIGATFQSDWTKSYLARRTPEQQTAALSLARNFGGGDADSLVVHYSSQRREFYTAGDEDLETLYSVDHNIFRRDALSYDFSDRLRYHITQNTSILVRGMVQNLTIDRSYLYKDFLQPSSITLDSRIQEMILSGSVSLVSRVSDWLEGNVGMSFEERDDRFTVMNQDGVPSTVFKSQEESVNMLEFTSQRTSAWGNIVSNLSGSDRLTLDGMASILRYDTPDSSNTDDRDELLLAVTVQETHNFNSYLSVGVEASATLSHLVYIDRMQSANNNWNRVISFSPRISLRPAEWLMSENEGRVVANYTVYDFEDQVASVKSYSFRQASWSDSTTLALSHRIDFGFSGILRAYERGILQWKEFEEIPVDYFIEESMWPQLKYTTSHYISLSVGYRYFSRDQYSYDGTTKTLVHTLTTAGPTVGVEWQGVGGTHVSMDGWREASTVDSGQATVVSNFSISVSLVF